MPTVHRLKITLKHVTPPVWRRVVVPSECTLAEVAALLLTAMGWAGYHLYSFRIGDATYVDLDDDWPEDAIDPAAVRFGDLVGPGDRFAFEYDFGDGWEHEVVVEKLLPTERRGQPICVAGRRACPPEDVGGPAGYADFLAAIADPAHDRHHELLDWIGGYVDPEHFDATDVDLTRPVQLYPPD